MADNKQPVEAAGLLSAIFKSLFGGLGKIFDAAAEYEEEMGVLKQVTTIPFTDNSDGKQYTLTIKLSPVKDKDGLFYVEAYTNNPRFDVSSLHDKVIKLNKDNLKQFNGKIQELFNKNDFQKTTEPTSESDNSNNEEVSEDIAELTDELDDHLKTTSFKATAEAQDKEGNTIEKDVSIDVDYVPGDPYEIELTAKDSNGDVLDGYPKETYELKVKGDNGKAVPFGTFWNDVKDSVSEYATDYNLSLKGFTFASTNVIDAQFVKASDGVNVELTAITANCNIKAALDIVEEVVESDEFGDLMEGDTTAIRITDDDDTYTIEEIDEVDTSNSYCDLFKEAAIVGSAFNTYRWAVGCNDWDNDSFLSGCTYPVVNFIDNCAVWVISHTDKFPNVIGTFGNDCTDLADLKEDGVISVQKVHDSAKALLEGLLEILDIYYVNLEHEEQKVVDDFMNEANRLLAYA